MQTWEEAEEARYDRADNDALVEDRQHRFNQRLQRKLINMDRDYPDSFHQQDVLEGIVDISDQEN